MKALCHCTGRAENQSGQTTKMNWYIYSSGKHECFQFTECSPWPETHFKPLSSSRRGKVMDCGLDYSASQLVFVKQLHKII